MTTNTINTPTLPRRIPAKTVELLGGELAALASGVNDAIAAAETALAYARTAAEVAERAPDLDAQAAADALQEGKPLPKPTAPKAIADADNLQRTAEAAVIVADRRRTEFRAAAARGPLAEARRAEALAKLAEAKRRARDAVNAVLPAIQAIETAARELADIESAPHVGDRGVAADRPKRLIGTAALHGDAWNATPAMLVSALGQCLPAEEGSHASVRPSDSAPVPSA